MCQLALSPDGRWLASIKCDGGTNRLWNLGTEQSRSVKGWNPVFSADNATLATNESGVGRLWDTATGEGRVLPDVYSNVALSPDGKLVAAIGKDGVIHLWNDDLPRDPAALKAWLQKATDYRVTAGSLGLTPDRP